MKINLRIFIIVSVLLSMSCRLQNPEYEFFLNWDSSRCSVLLNGEILTSGHYQNVYYEPVLLTVEVISETNSLKYLSLEFCDSDGSGYLEPESVYVNPYTFQVNEYHHYCEVILDRSF